MSQSNSIEKLLEIKNSNIKFFKVENYRTTKMALSIILKLSSRAFSYQPFPFNNT
jgi:hypothetical protein